MLGVRKTAACGVYPHVEGTVFTKRRQDIGEGGWIQPTQIERMIDDRIISPARGWLCVVVDVGVVIEVIKFRRKESRSSEGSE